MASLANGCSGCPKCPISGASIPAILIVIALFLKSILHRFGFLGPKHGIPAG